ncbi:hypothetical protein [Pseudomonas asiatica]|uniref:Lipoprotein n=1 Tax=Pseudomonas asiatica TaxID=2219225 RepID=A0A9X4D0A7_9PSED|nr:hypothetical protein [Pseudomonas asiatica]MDD2106810.1 hypothetical protein [Pseudomonas asiatica]
MKNHKAVRCAILLSVGLLASCDRIQSPETAFLKACEAELQSRMKAPSTFKLLEKDVVAKELSLEEWVEAEPPSSELQYELRELLYKNGQKAKEYMASMKYEAANRYGTPIAETSVCTMVSADIREDLNRGTTADFKLKIDGQSSNDLQLSEIEALTGLRRKN